jgi:hypothetical protein
MLERRQIIAEFHKDSGGRLSLWSLTTITEQPLKDGSDGTYLSRDIYDVEKSRRFGYIYHMSGCGGRGPVPVEGVYFATGGAEIEERPCTLVDPKDSPPWRGKKTLAIRARNKTRRLRALPRSFTPRDGGDLMDWLEVNGIEQDAVWCSECRDCYPSDQLCEHCWWCDKIGCYSTPNDRCKCSAVEAEEHHQ